MSRFMSGQTGQRDSLKQINELPCKKCPVAVPFEKLTGTDCPDVSRSVPAVSRPKNDLTC